MAYADPGAQPFQAPSPEAMNVGAPTFNRVGWQNMQADQVPGWENLTPDKQEQKMAALKSGGEMADAHPVFPETRPCNDVCFILLFWGLAGGMLVWAAMNFSVVQDAIDSLTGRLPNNIGAEINLGLIGTAAGVSTFAGIIGCAAFVYLLGSSPSCVVWSSLICGPILIIVMGAALFVSLPEQIIVAGILVAVGLCSLACTFFCLRDCIPFTIEVADCLADVIKENPSTVAISLVGGLFGLVWPMLVLFSAIATVPVFEDVDPRMIVLPYFFILLWGAQIGYYYTHCILCGVFGRWYHKKDQASPMCSSIKNATTTSLGSIAFAAFLVAAVRTVQLAIQLAREKAQEEGNPALMAVLCCLECLVACVADLLEWFSEWALVQVAIRGTSFIESAKITYTMATQGNLMAIITALIIDSVANMAMLLCMAFSGLAAGGAVYLGSSESPNQMTLTGIGAGIGLLPGAFIGTTAGALVSSGAKSVLMSWAEMPEVLAQLRPELALKFEKAASGVDA